jgi:hypothetical protein
MSARDEAAAEFDAGTPLLVGEQVTAYAAAIRAEVLREAADAADSRKESHTVGAVADVLRRMADEAPRDELAEAVAQMGALPVPLGNTEPATAPDVGHIPDPACPVGGHIPGVQCDDKCTTQARALAALQIRLEGGTP